MFDRSEKRAIAAEGLLTEPLPEDSEADADFDRVPSPEPSAAPEPTVEELVRDHMALVHHMARPYAKLGVHLCDLEQEGVIGLLTAAERFDPDKGVKFSTFARYWVRYRMQRHLRAHRAVVPIPQTRAIRRVRRRLRAVTAQLEASGEAASDADIARELGVTEEDVGLVRAALGQRDAALESERLRAQPRRPRESSPEVLSARAELRRQAERLVLEGLADLDTRERRIIAERRLSESPRSLRELGEALEISAERVRQLEQRAYRKMRRQLEAAGSLEAAQRCAQQLAS